MPRLAFTIRHAMAAYTGLATASRPDLVMVRRPDRVTRCHPDAGSPGRRPDST
jgi:hypothetical protein